jgi:hypothetical protein
MRSFLLSLPLLFLGTALLPAQAYADDKPVNTICPKSGDAIDPDVTPVTVTTKEGKTVIIGVCCKKCAAAITANPDAYVAAALANQKK